MGLPLPLYEPDPEPDQLSNLYPELGVAEMDTELPALYQLLEGETVPPPEGLEVVASRY